MARNLAAWLNELAERHPPEHMDFGLERMHQAMARLGLNNRPDALVVAVAGTNGKGSCAMLLEATLRRAGATTGLYLSPHLYNFCERLQINGQHSQAQAWVSAFDAIDAAAGNLGLTFFEWVTLAAFIQLYAVQPQVWVLEIGLGGRLDAVNALDNQCNLITSIDYDHTDRLGNSLSAIASEKAGVMRAGRYTLCGSTLTDFPVLAARAGAQLLQLGRDWNVVETGGKVLVDFHSSRLSSPLVPGVFAVNQAMAMLAAQLLCNRLGLHMPVLDWMGQVSLPGRQQLCQLGGIRCLLDVCHNRAGIDLLARRVAKEFGAMPMVGVFGCLADKQPPQNLALLFPNVHTWVTVGIEGVRGQSAAEVARKAGLVDALELHSLDAARMWQLAGKGMLLAFGSFFVAPQLRDMLEAS